MDNVVLMPPPVTGHRTVAVDAYGRAVEERDAAVARVKVLRRLFEDAEAARDKAQRERNDMKLAIVEGRYLKPRQVWFRLALTAVGFLLIGYLLGRAML